MISDQNSQNSQNRPNNQNNQNNYLILRTGLGKDLLYKTQNIQTEPVYNLYQFVELKTGVKPKLQRFSYGSKFLDPRKYLGNYGIQNGSCIDFNIGLKGGVLGSIGNVNPFGWLKEAWKDTKSAFSDAWYFMGNLFEDFGRIFIWLYKLMIWVVVDILNPTVWFKGFIKGLFDGTRIVILFILEFCLTLIKKAFNTILGPVFSNIWGYDMTDKNNKCKKCFSTKTGSLPFSVIIGTILMPPLGVFMELGLVGWINILICALLTAAFYFPGLIYALMILYC